MMNNGCYLFCYSHLYNRVPIIKSMLHSCSNSDDSDSPTEGPGVGYEPSSPSYSPSSPEIMGGGALLSHETLDRNADSPPQRRKRRVLKKKLNHHWRTGGKGKWVCCIVSFK